MKRTIVIVGPTASGKSDVAISLAKKFNGEVISCDSRQIYRGMDIGTGKIPGTFVPVIPNESSNRGISNTYPTFISEGVPHYMIDIVSPNTPYNATKFVKKAKKIRKDIWKRGKLPIICGGTGFWAQALVENISFPEVAPNFELRNQLRNSTTEELLAMLKKKDPRRAKTIDSNNRVHIVRSLEICKTLGAVPKITNNDLQIRDYKSLVIAIDVPREKLYKKIEKRLDERLQQGMLDEIWSLHHEKHVPWSRMEVFGLEYRWVSRYLRGIISHEEMREKLLLDIQHYAKRQLTWLRRWERQGRKIHWKQNLQEIKSILPHLQ